MQRLRSLKNGENPFQNLSIREALALITIVIVLSSLSSAYLESTSDNSNFLAWQVSWLQNFSTEVIGAVAIFVLFELILSNRHAKEQLIREMRSPDNATANLAVESLRERGEVGWLIDGTLHCANLTRANLENANLYRADLKGADLSYATLRGANLEDAILIDAIFSEYTTLPNGEYWSQATDLRAFTNSMHPQYWRSSDKMSPAFKSTKY